MKTEAILGIDVGALFLDARYFAAYAPRENKLYYGEAAEFNLKDFMQIEIETAELTKIFAGLAQVAIDSTTTMTRKDGKLVFHSSNMAGASTVWIDPGKMVVTKSELVDTQGRVILKREFQRFKRKGGVFLPRTVKITRPLAKERLTVVYTSQKVNKKIPAKIFVNSAGSISICMKSFKSNSAASP